MSGGIILALFFAFCFIVMSIKYLAERKRYEKCNYNRKYWLRKYKEIYNKYEINR